MLSNGVRCDTRTDGKGVLMRLHRDTRFSPDKTPYHTHISGLFWEGGQKKTERPAFGFQIEATGMGLMGDRRQAEKILRISMPQQLTSREVLQASCLLVERRYRSMTAT